MFTGLFSKSVWKFENDAWNRLTGGDASETGSGPGSYDIRKSVWHINCCSPQVNGGGGWGIFNSLFGWTNSATYGSVISYNLYWLVVIVSFLTLGFWEKRQGKVQSDSETMDSDAASSENLEHEKKTQTVVKSSDQTAIEA